MFRVCQKKLMFRVWRLHGFTQIYYISFGSFPIERSLAHFFPPQPRKNGMIETWFEITWLPKKRKRTRIQFGSNKKPCSHHLSIDTDVWETPASREKEKKRCKTSNSNFGRCSIVCVWCYLQVLSLICAFFPNRFSSGITTRCECVVFFHAFDLLMKLRYDRMVDENQCALI